MTTKASAPKGRQSRRRRAAVLSSEAAHAQTREWISGFNEEALLADGFEDAIIGVGERCGQPALVIYDAEKCIEILQERDGMSYDDAYEFFTFNTLGAWIGEHTPVFMWRKPEQWDPQTVEQFTDTPK